MSYNRILGKKRNGKVRYYPTKKQRGVSSRLFFPILLFRGIHWIGSLFSLHVDTENDCCVVLCSFVSSSFRVGGAWLGLKIDSCASVLGQWTGNF